jgi:hypothetical protein
LYRLPTRQNFLHTHPLATHVPVSRVAENYLCFSRKTAVSPENGHAAYLFQTRQTSAGMSETRQAYDHGACRLPGRMVKIPLFWPPLAPIERRLRHGTNLAFHSASKSLIQE